MWKARSFLPGEEFRRASVLSCPMPSLDWRPREDLWARSRAEWEGPSPEDRWCPLLNGSSVNNTACLSSARPGLSGPPPARSRPRNPARPFHSSLASGAGPTAAHVYASENGHVREAASGPLTNFTVPESPVLTPVSLKNIKVTRLKSQRWSRERGRLGSQAAERGQSRGLPGRQRPEGGAETGDAPLSPFSECLFHELRF